MNFFLDNMMSPKLHRILAILYGHEHKIEHVRTEGRFAANTKDEIWMGQLCRDVEPWAIISGDMRMLNRPNIIADLHNSNNIFLVMDENWCNRNTDHSQAWKLLKVWPEIVAFSSLPGPRFYEIGTAGTPKVAELRLSKRARARRLKLTTPTPIVSPPPSSQSPTAP